MIQRKKLIEVSLPLDAINTASAREKSIRQGHPSTLHLWWARRPLAAARAVIFSQMVDDPSSYIDELKSDTKLKRKAAARLKARLKVWKEAQDLYQKAQSTTASVPEPGAEPTLDEALADIERERLFTIIEELVKWENTNNDVVLHKAQDEIWQSWRRTCADNADHPNASEIFDRNNLPAFHDPFAGGGALPLEAQRLGLESHASDLNPVAVLINKAMIEIPPKFSGQAPVNSKSQADAASSGSWKGASGLAEDVRFYGQWMRDKAEKKIGQLYPKVEVTAEMVKERPDLEPYLDKKLTVISWLWARTVKSPNPAYSNVNVPLASTFMLSTKKGKEVYIEPMIEGGSYQFNVVVGKPADLARAKSGTSAGKRSGFICMISGAPITYDYIREEGAAGRMGTRLMAVVAEGSRGRVYLSPKPEYESIARNAQPEWKPDTPLHGKCRVNVSNYGFDVFGDLFTDRQLVALTTLSNVIAEAHDQIELDSIAAGLSDDGKGIEQGGIGAASYAEAVCVYLASAIGKASDYNSSICSWISGGQTMRNTFGRQAIPMVWDFAEANPLGNSTGCFLSGVDQVARVIDKLPASKLAYVTQSDATTQTISKNKVVSTDPPYYDNIAYADLSDFFYIWMRRSLRNTFSYLFATMTVPKTEELVATPYRHGSKAKAEVFFIEGMTKAMHQLANQANELYPLTIYYAFKQAETKNDTGTVNTGWDTFLEAVIKAGFAITGTWPMRTELANKLIGVSSNMLASSIVLVCRPRPINSPSVSRREFLNTLKSELPNALAKLQSGNIAPVDLAQAAIGPGMAIYTRYTKVLDAEGNSLNVRTALTLINQVLDEVLAEQEGDFDADTRWALTWFEQNGFEEDDYGNAEQLSKAKNTGVEGLIEAGIILLNNRKVRILKPSELPSDWNPDIDKRLTVWEMVHHLIRKLEYEGESASGELVAKLGSKAETARELCYRLYMICERKKRASEAISYNTLVQSWPEITRLAQEISSGVPTTGDLFE